MNCGACGLQGCEAYAEMVARGELGPDLCVPGGDAVAKAVGRIMGVEVKEKVKMRAVVLCQGGREECGMRFDYDGEPDCRAAAATMGGPKKCPSGCLGFGTCAQVCPFGAITMSENRLPVIDKDLCTACGLCVRTCPRGIIKLIPADCHVWVACSTPARGKGVKATCSRGCISCQICVKKDPKQAIRMENNLPVLDYEAGSDFLEAAEKCPQNCFVVENVAEPAGAGQATA